MAIALLKSGTAWRLVFFGGRTAGMVAISYFLHQTSPHKLERAFLIYASGDSADGGGLRLPERSRIFVA
jgi:hypothetical protein